jgi:hypothetical protein
LLAEAGFIPEPDLDDLVRVLLRDRLDLLGEVFLKASRA